MTSHEGLNPQRPFHVGKQDLSWAWKNVEDLDRRRKEHGVA